MAAQDRASQGGIFEGAEKVEILGKLPALLWAYIISSRSLMDTLGTTPENYSGPMASLERVLSVLSTAADYLGNEKLKGRLNGHGDLLAALSSGKMTSDRFSGSLKQELVELERLAGPRPETLAEGVPIQQFLDHELRSIERIKSGRSGDIVVSMEILDDVRSYLINDGTIEGISSYMVIDSAGSLVVSVGQRVEIDTVSLAAVAAANFAATERIARLIGEPDFILLYYKGHKESFHFSRVSDEYIIVTIFDNSLSLGLLRLKIAEVAQVLEKKLPKREN
ncbi:MAG: roadblock/LC7 domain-containing protein [Thermodesulfobacteriota bacterium]